jgi:5-methylcytosine-specific restriction endonuclease McrA
MDFDSAKALKKATGRAKSDVANKLVSMFLHEVSRRACLAGGMTVSDLRYRDDVLKSFGHSCLYCGRDLEPDRASVEHLDGMNRFRAGLHVPGNVAMACRPCNNEKRRDDQKTQLSLASSGWESFLSHDRSRCEAECKTCSYWASLWPDDTLRVRMLDHQRERIRHFQEPYNLFITWSESVRPSIQNKVEVLYRACQDFATDEIEKLSSELVFDFTSFSNEFETK